MRFMLPTAATLALILAGCAADAPTGPALTADQIRIQAYGVSVLDTTFQSGCNGVRSAEAWDINTKGRIVGMVYCLQGHVPVWWRATDHKPFAFPQPVNSTYSFAQAINDKNQAVGFTNFGTGERGVYWATGTTVQLLGTLGGAKSNALDINDAGVVVGWADLSNGDFHAFTWSQSWRR